MCAIEFNPGYSDARDFSVDFDDTYFRGGDVLQYFWHAASGDVRKASYPAGIPMDPSELAGIADAEIRTGGLLEFNALPTIAWDPAYVAAVQADPVGDIAPTPAQIANSTQSNCILYVNKVNFARRSGSTNRTSFMYTLDRLGYRGDYDVYDLQGFGNTNNDLGGRATVAQASAYALIVHDVGRLNSATIPNGTDKATMKINQAQWYRDYLDQGGRGLAGVASLWVIGENWATDTWPHGLTSTDLALAEVFPAQERGRNPDVQGTASYSFVNGNSVDFVDVSFSLNGGCPAMRRYDSARPGTSAVGVLKYKEGDLLSDGSAMVVNKSDALNWNAVATLFNWFDMRDKSGGLPPGPPPGQAELTLARRVLGGVLPAACVQLHDPTDVAAAAAPRVTALHQAYPNPFNPTTTIAFDLAVEAEVQLRVYDLAGRLVRNLVGGQMEAHRHQVLWNGLDERGQRVGSGLYLVRFEAGGVTATRKLILVR
jgi:hypothetical protein